MCVHACLRVRVCVMKVHPLSQYLEDVQDEEYFSLFRVPDSLVQKKGLLFGTFSSIFLNVLLPKLTFLHMIAICRYRNSRKQTLLLFHQSLLSLCGRNWECAPNCSLTGSFSFSGLLPVSQSFPET